ncbi:MAG: hypothetical protein BRC27_00905 [Nanohaloarchaea archaeon SW_10_44_10]|nr:MAG: hypothetical protein BRC27_00905 [Nanohaloarchaea archaeon SW_10_44_10]
MKLHYVSVLLLAAFFMVAGATAVVGGPETREGEMAIMSSGSSASASTTVGENGTEWRAETSMVNRSSSITEPRLENVQFSEENNTVTFTGHIVAPTPCHVIQHEVEESEDKYILNVKTVNDLESNGNQSIQACAQVLTMIEYEGEFSNDEASTLEVQHKNETVRTLEHPGIDTEPVPKPETNTGFFNSLRNFFSDLF